MVFNWLDYLLIGFFISGIFLGFLQGYLWQLFRIACLILAFFLALFFSSIANKVLGRFLNTESMNYLGHAAIFFGTLLITYIIGVLVAKTRTDNSSKKRILGGMLGVVKNVVFCSIIITGLWILGTEKERRPINYSTIGTKLRIGTTFALYKLPRKIFN
ncbi:MAG: CvpA family protein [Candidatus Anammoxibacter sp.]